MSKTIIEALYDYFNESSLLTDNRLNVDYLPENTKQAGIEYAIITMKIIKDNLFNLGLRILIIK